VGRLFWTFPDGLPGLGLLLMRLALSGGVLYRCLAAWPAESRWLDLLCVAESIAALLLLAGVATPIWGAGAAVVELWRAYSEPADVLVHVLLATLGAALALVGPGALSVDARVFGWRRIDVPQARSGIVSRHQVPDRHSKGSTDASN
jgi:putative oxidoreductase